MQNPLRASFGVQRSGLQPSAHCDISLVRFIPRKARLDCLITSLRPDQIVSAMVNAAKTDSSNCYA